jgi:hypothetical protein
MRNPPFVLDYPASADDPDDPEPARVKQVNAERCADHQRRTEAQRHVAIDALSILLAHVDELIGVVNATPPGEPRAATATVGESAPPLPPEPIKERWYRFLTKPWPIVGAVIGATITALVAITLFILSRK